MIMDLLELVTESTVRAALLAATLLTACQDRDGAASTANAGTAGSRQDASGATPNANTTSSRGGTASVPNGIAGTTSSRGGATTSSGDAGTTSSHGGTSSASSGSAGTTSSRGGAGSSVGGTTALASGGSSATSGSPATASAESLGAFPVASSTKTRGGTMTFTNVGAPGWWPRRIDRAAGDPACTYKDGTDTWGGHCCMKEQYTNSSALSPFDEELTLILKAIDVKQLAIYQPATVATATSWSRVTAWDARSRRSENLWFTQQGAGSTTFPGDLTKTDCVGYVMQEPRFDCGNGRDYFCPDDAGILHRGYSGSKLVVLLASMSFSDSGVKSCSGTGAGRPAPWVAFVASELVRDGGRKWNGLCNCYSKTGTVGDGCGEINVFEVVMDDNAYSNREFASTGVRSYQAGHIGGAVAGATVSPSTFAADSEVIDVCAKTAYTHGPVLVAGGATNGCPVWRRPTGDRYFFILLDEPTRSIQVGIVHPENLPAAVGELLPTLPALLSRGTIDAMAAMRLPE